jgi:hypothetical protein
MHLFEKKYPQIHKTLYNYQRKKLINVIHKYYLNERFKTL